MLYRQGGPPSAKIRKQPPVGWDEEDKSADSPKQKSRFWVHREFEGQNWNRFEIGKLKDECSLYNLMLAG
jgi:hypothetical protein